MPKKLVLSIDMFSPGEGSREVSSKRPSSGAGAIAEMQKFFATRMIFRIFGSLNGRRALGTWDSMSSVLSADQKF